jgi:hypothetical protein
MEEDGHTILVLEEEIVQHIYQEEPDARFQH